MDDITRAPNTVRLPLSSAATDDRGDEPAKFSGEMRAGVMAKLFGTAERGELRRGVKIFASRKRDD